MNNHALMLDIATLYLVATLVAVLLGGLLLYFWRQEKIAALGWWGAAYLAGGVAIATWTIGAPYLPAAALMALNVIGLIACGMVWNAARVFHGNPTSADGVSAGAVLWALASLQLSEFSPLRMVLGAGVVAVYAVLTANELWSERRKAYKTRWPAIGVIPALHGLVLMLPIIVGDVVRPAGHALGNAWIAAFTIELVLYAVGTVFIICLMVSEAHREGAQDSGRDRSAHRAVQPARFFRTVRAHGDRSARLALVGRSRCCCSTSITSSRSTTASVIRPVTRSSSCLPTFCSTPFA